MEYELLKFLASHPGKVFSRETLLSRSGLHYFGGARTVDVHIRRLRGSREEHATDPDLRVVYSFGPVRAGG